MGERESIPKGSIDLAPFSPCHVAFKPLIMGGSRLEHETPHTVDHLRSIILLAQSPKLCYPILGHLPIYVVLSYVARIILCGSITLYYD